MAEDRPVFYAHSPGGWRDYWTLLHPPYTMWHLSYVVVGACLAPVLNVPWLLETLAAFFLAMGLAAHALDELHGRPLRTRIPDGVERGELKLEQASMQGIKDWGAKNPDNLPGLLASNPSIVIFRELPNGLSGPLGSLGVPLTGGRSIAVDPRFIPLGAPVFLATTQPNSPQPLNRLVMAQDTGSAIRGGVRADFFWGFGDTAGELAGRMKQRGRVWVLLPRDYPPSSDRR